MTPKLDKIEWLCPKKYYNLQKAGSCDIFIFMQRLLFIPIFLCVIACQSEKQRAAEFVAQFGATDAARRTEASKALVAIGSGAVDALIQGLSDEHLQVREMSAWDAQRNRCAGCPRRPCPLFRRSPIRTKIFASSVLSRYRNLGEPAVPYLIEALTAESMEIRLNAAYALGEIGTPLATILPALIRTLTDPGVERPTSGCACLGYNRNARY